MNLYWLSREGGAAEGPFTEDQLLAMWRSGAITANAMVCLEGCDDWTLWRDEVGRLEKTNLDERARVMKRERALGEEKRRLAMCKSELGAAVASFFVPGLGHLYAGESWQGLTLLLLCWGLWVLGIQAGSDGVVALGIAFVLWLVGLLDAPGAVRRHNARF